MKGGITPYDYDQDENKQRFNSIFVANFKEHTTDGTILRVRNKISAGDTLELLEPGGQLRDIKLDEYLLKSDGTSCKVAQNEDEILILQQLKPYTILRKVIK